MLKYLTLASLLLAAAVFAQAPDALVILSPAPDSYISGPTTLRVLLHVSSGSARLAFYVDANLACTIDRAPWECQWDDGGTVAEHQVRAVATLSNGRRLVHNIRQQL
jgi:hypothetical protein